MFKLHLRQFYFGVLLLFIIVAPIIAQESTAEPVVPSDTPPPSPTFTEPATFAPLPTATATETATATASPTATETATATVWPTETPTETATQAEVTAESFNEALVGAASAESVWNIPLSDGVVSCHNAEICASVSVQAGTSHDTYIEAVSSVIQATITFDHYISGITYNLTIQQPPTPYNVNNGYRYWYNNANIVDSYVWQWPGTAWAAQTYENLNEVQSSNRFEIYLNKFNSTASFSLNNFSISAYTLGASLATPIPTTPQTPLPPPTAINTAVPQPPTPPPPVGGACGASNVNQVTLYSMPDTDSESLLLPAGSSFNIVELNDYIHGATIASWYKIKVAINGQEQTKYLEGGTILNLNQADCTSTTIVKVTYETVDSNGGGTGGGTGGGGTGTGTGWTPDGIISYQTLPPPPEGYFNSTCLAILNNVALHVQPSADSPISFVAPSEAYPQIGAKTDVNGVTWYRVSYFQKYIAAHDDVAAEWRFYLYTGWFDGTGFDIEALSTCTNIPNYQQMGLPVIVSSVPQVVFSNENGGDSEIYLATGTSYTALTNNSFEDINPSFSPDGQRVAFQSFRDGLRQVRVINTDGTGEQGIAFNDAREPDWYPDGTALVFARGSEIYKINADGTGEVALTNHGAGVVAKTPAISHDGNWIVYQAQGGFYILDAHCTSLCSPSLLVDNGNFEFPAWSPDDQQLAYSLGEDIFIAEVDYSSPIPQLINIVANGGNTDDKDTHPAWSSDGQLLFAKNSNVYKCFGSCDPILQNANGAEELQLANCQSNPDLALYQVSVCGSWDANEILAILTGVENVGETFQAFSTQEYATPQEAFIAVMFIDPSVSSQRIVFEQLSTDEKYCTTTKTPNPNNNVRALIQCGQGNAFTEYTAVHELGHVFLHQTANDEPINPNLPSPCDYVAGTPALINCIENPDSTASGAIGALRGTFLNSFVFGTVTQYYTEMDVERIIERFDPDGKYHVTSNSFAYICTDGSSINAEGYCADGNLPLTGVTDWSRGRRGWDGALLEGFGACNDAAENPYTISSFQQNPCYRYDWILEEASPEVSVINIVITEQEETGADMFLNWVYRANPNPNPLAFGDNADSFTTGDYASREPVSRGAGDDRWYWMNDLMILYFEYYGW